ncbi:MAG: hypothetical protein U9N56_11790 [Actinomycetota bacterium]|nr:hypothetical protein [Actinomycetota bacterium]
MWTSSPPTVFPWRFTVPWYWSDEIARILIDSDRITRSDAQVLIERPVALRRAEATIETAALGLQDDDEIPLAA